MIEWRDGIILAAVAIFAAIAFCCRLRKDEICDGCGWHPDHCDCVRLNGLDVPAYMRDNGDWR